MAACTVGVQSRTRYMILVRWFVRPRHAPVLSIQRLITERSDDGSCYHAIRQSCPPCRVHSRPGSCVCCPLRAGRCILRTRTVSVLLFTTAHIREVSQSIRCRHERELGGSLSGCVQEVHREQEVGRGRRRGDDGDGLFRGDLQCIRRGKCRPDGECGLLLAAQYECKYKAKSKVHDEYDIPGIHVVCM